MLSELSYMPIIVFGVIPFIAVAFIAIVVFFGGTDVQQCAQPTSATQGSHQCACGEPECNFAASAQVGGTAKPGSGKGGEEIVLF